MGAYVSQAHFRAALCAQFGQSLKFNKEVRKSKVISENTAQVHLVHARCQYSGKSRVKQAERKRNQSSTQSLVLTVGCYEKSASLTNACMTL